MFEVVVLGMKVFFLRLFFILTIVFTEVSFFDVIFSQFIPPLVLITSVVVWVLVSGFPLALFMTIPLTLFFDVISSGMPGSLTLYSVLLAYATSFLSRRILLEHTGIGLILYALFTAFAALGYMFFDFIFFGGNSFSGITIRLMDFLAAISFSQILFSVILVFPVFVFMYQIIRRFEKHANLLSQRDFFAVK